MDITLHWVTERSKAKIKLQDGLFLTFDWYFANNDFFTSVSNKLYDKRLGLKTND